jgi:hypothetical protein
MIALHIIPISFSLKKQKHGEGQLQEVLDPELLSDRSSGELPSPYVYRLVLTSQIKDTCNHTLYLTVCESHLAPDSLGAEDLCCALAIFLSCANSFFPVALHNA